MKSPFSLMGLFLFLRARRKPNFQNLAIFGLLEPFCIENKFFNFFVHRAEIFRIFAPLIENSKFLEND